MANIVLRIALVCVSLKTLISDVINTTETYIEVTTVSAEIQNFAKNLSPFVKPKVGSKEPEVRRPES